MTKTTKKRARRSTTLLFALFFFVLLGALTRVCDGAGYYAYYKRRHDDNDDKVYCYNGADHQNTGDPRDCFNTCDSCSSCDSFVYKVSDKQCQFLNHNSYGKTEGDSNYEWYRPIEIKLTNTDFETHVAGCLAEAPVDGLCKEYGGRGFSGSDNLNIGSMPDWDVSKVTDMETAFRDKTTFNGDLSNWDVSKVTSMNRMFYNAEDFNQDISNWNVASVEDMNGMFYDAEDFNQDISNWNVASVEDMNRMFKTAIAFNKDISGWNVLKVETMGEMFCEASTFNHFVGGWTENSALTSTNMFQGATAFLEKYTSASCGISAKPSECRVPLTDGTFSEAIADCLLQASTSGECETYGASSGYGVMPDWDVSGVTDMSEAFKDKDTFNADLSSWDVSSVENMENMFYNAQAFNRNIGNWNVAKVENMNRMFYNAEAFNQNIEDWNVASVENMENMFYGASIFNKDISGWDVSQVETMQEMFYGASSFDQDISGWDVAKVGTMEKMFYLASSFNQDVSDWSVSASATITDMFTGSAFAKSRLLIEVTVSNDGATTSDEEFALGVSVSANACTGTDSSCDLSGGGTSTETDDARAEGGLYCDVSVHTQGTTCSSPSISGTIECMSWPNFYNHAKASAYRYALTTTESGGSVIAGDYTVSYTCEWKFKGTNEAPGASMNIATAQGTAAFKVAQGCSDTLPTALSTISLPDLFVLSVPEFLAVTDSDDCDNVETILETAFRKYDTSPLDGTLHASEWEKAFLQHDVSTRYVKSEYNSASFTLSQVINSAMLPLVCEKAKDGFSSADVYFDSITYPDKNTVVDSGSEELDSCNDATEKLTVTLGFGTTPTSSDAVCVYSDGYLFKDYESEDFSSKTFEDKRPSMRTGDDAI
jgi:surface protein